MKCLPREISVALISLGRSLLHRGGTYSSGVAPAAGTGDCPVKFRKNERCGFIGVSWKWSSAYLTGKTDLTHWVEWRYKLDEGRIPFSGARWEFSTRKVEP
jgi:hypothetical protein